VSLQVPTPTLTLSPPPTVVSSRNSSDASMSPLIERNSKKRKNSDDSTVDPSKAVKRTTSNSLRRRGTPNVLVKKGIENAEEREIHREMEDMNVPKRKLRSRR